MLYFMHFSTSHLFSKTHTNLPVTPGVVELLTIPVVGLLGVGSENWYKLMSKAKIYIGKTQAFE